MRILITTDVVGGVWQFTHELTAGLLGQGAAVALVSLGGSPSDDQRRQCADLSTRFGDAFLYESCSAPLEWMEKNEDAYHDAAGLLARVAKEFGAQVLHSNQFCFGAIPLDIPKVITAHSDVLSWAEACRGGALENSPWLRQYSRLVSDGLNGASLVIAPTRWMLNALRRSFPFRARCEVIPNGRSIPAGAQRARHFRAITAGRLWDEAKDIRMLGEVCSPIPLYAAGETQQGSGRGPESVRGVTLLGHLSEEELFDFFRASEVYICTSRYEPFGLAALEAAQCGCAVLARDLPSLREVWQDSALYFSDAQSLSALLEQLVADPEALAAAQERSRTRAQWFTAERMVDGYRAQFEKVVSDAEAKAYAA